MTQVSQTFVGNRLEVWPEAAQDPNKLQIARIRAPFAAMAAPDWGTQRDRASALTPDDTQDVRSPRVRH